MSDPWRAAAPGDTETFSPRTVFEAGLRNHHVSNTAYPLAHGTTWAPYRVAAAQMQATVQRAWNGIDDLCLYVHIPFCETRCSFCEYTVVRREEIPWMQAYVDDLLREFDLYAEALGSMPRRFHGFDLGGGTPLFLPAEEIARVVERARKWFLFARGSDISIETTPRIAAADPEKLAACRRMGIDRISMGLQVIQPDLLKMLNRSENGVDQHRRAVQNIRESGFRRLNVDLMYGFAGQDVEGWRATLQHAIELEPEYITLYRMRYKLTRISHHAPSVTLDQVRPMIRLAKAMLADAGYRATPGKTTYSRIPGDVGTSSYLARRVIDGMPYLGLGLGAQSFTHTTISYNDGAVAKNLLPYRRSIAAGRLPLQDLYDLPARQMMGKMCAVSFYFGEIDTAAFQSKFGLSLETVFREEIDFLLQQRLVEWTPRSLRLTDAGALNVSGVIALFFAPSIQRYLVDRDPERADDLHQHRLRAAKVAGEPAHV